MVMDAWAKDTVAGDLLGRPCARLDIPTIDRRTLQDVGAVLHELANTLTRLSLNPPGETLRERTALVMAQDAVKLANKHMRRLLKQDEAEIKRAKVMKFGVERKVS